METWCWDCSLDRPSKGHQPDTELSQEQRAAEIRVSEVSGTYKPPHVCAAVDHKGFYQDSAPQVLKFAASRGGLFSRAESTQPQGLKKEAYIHM